MQIEIIEGVDWFYIRCQGELKGKQATRPSGTCHCQLFVRMRYEKNEMLRPWSDSLDVDQGWSIKGFEAAALAIWAPRRRRHNE
jgi:hypothetical protein